MSGAAFLAVCAALLLMAAVRELPASLRFAATTSDWLARSLQIAGLAALGGTDSVELRIARAGLSSRMSPAGVLILRCACAVAGLLCGLVAAPGAPGRLAWIVPIGLPAAAFFVPDALLERAARRRRERLLAELPDALDRLAVSAATGRGGAAGLAELAGGGGGPLAFELAISRAELTAGVPQERALAGFRERVGGAQAAALVAAIDRSRRYGSPLADQLRRQASSLRVDQRRAVQERAARAAPKIQLVVALVLVPSVLLMIAAGLLANSDVLFSAY